MEKKRTQSGMLRFVVLNLIGLIIFFVPFDYNKVNSIFIDHAATVIKAWMGPTGVAYLCLLMMLGGAGYPFVKKTWNQDKTTMLFSIFKVIGAILGIMYVFKIGPAYLYTPDMMPFLFEKLVGSLAFVIPIGGALIIFLTSYGLMEFIGVFARPFMRPVYRTPGMSAIDAVASFVGSYSIGLLITDKQYCTGRYTAKEAAIIATGFSTVSATFCVVVAKTLNLMDMWNLFFWATMAICFIVTAITVRLWPLKHISDEYMAGVEPYEEKIVTDGLFVAALEEGLEASNQPVSILKNLVTNFVSGFLMTMSILPSIMSVGLLGLILSKYTPIFDILGYLFYPVTVLFFSDPVLVGKAAALGIAEMFLPAILVKDSDLITRFVIAVTSISGILFFSASIPCVMSTKIPISVRDMVVVWFQRVVLTILITAPVAIFLFR